jgi:hypothetical protein
LNCKTYPLEKFAGILMDTEAEEIKQAIATEYWQVNVNAW